MQIFCYKCGKDINTINTRLDVSDIGCLCLPNETLWGGPPYSLDEGLELGSNTFYFTKGGGSLIRHNSNSIEGFGLRHDSY